MSSAVLADPRGAQSAFVGGVIDDTTFNMVSECGPQSQSAFTRGFVDDRPWTRTISGFSIRRNPRSRSASSMTGMVPEADDVLLVSQSAFVRGFIDDLTQPKPTTKRVASQSAFVRGFIDDFRGWMTTWTLPTSQSAFVRGFIDDLSVVRRRLHIAIAVSIRVRARLHR